MESWDILKKEEQYRKENELFESKTKALFEKVDNVMKMQDSLIKDTNKKAEALYRRHKSTSFTKGDINERGQSDFPEISLDDPSIPSMHLLNDMGQKGMHHFYRAKIKSLKEECMKQQAEAKAKTAEVKKLQKDLAQATEDKDKWYLQCNLGKTQIGKMEKNVSTITTKLQYKDNEIAVYKKEIDALKKEIKNISQNSGTSDAKLNKALEESEKHKTLVKSLKKDEKELRESHKKQIQELSIAIQQVEKHKNELVHGFKKQLQLIDNLKKQKIHLETFNVAQLAEAEFMKILDWKGGEQ